MKRDRRTSSLFLVLLLAVVCSILAPAAFCADAAAPATPTAAADSESKTETTQSQPDTEEAVPTNPLSMIWRSGYIGYFICLLSVVTVGLIIENLMSLKREKMMPEDLLADIENALENGSYEEALDYCQSEDCMMTRILGAGLSKMPYGFERMEEALAEEADAQATLLHQKIGYINLIAGIAPMLGLLGTVSGMIRAFGDIASNPQASPALLAKGIYIALMTTLLGLIVAIPASAAFAFFKGRITKILIIMSIINGEILDHFRADEQEEPQEE